MWSHGVVVDAPSLDEHARFDAIAEPFEVEALVAQAPIEAFIGPVLPWLARVDEGEVNPRAVRPRGDGVRNELGAIVTGTIPAT